MQIVLEKVTFSLIKNLKTVCSHINCRWQVSRQQYAEFPATISNAIISEAKDFFWIFYSISEMYMKFRAFSKKHEYPSLIISEIIDTERSGYLNV